MKKVLYVVLKVQGTIPILDDTGLPQILRQFFCSSIQAFDPGIYRFTIILPGSIITKEMGEADDDLQTVVRTYIFAGLCRNPVFV